MTPSMTIYRRGDVVLVPFPFSEMAGAKRRPALVVSSDRYNSVGREVIIAQITSRIQALPRPGDHKIAEWRDAGLLAPSLVRARLATLSGSLIARKLGNMPEPDMRAIGRSLANALGLASM